MNKANEIKQLIDRQLLDEAASALREASSEDLALGDRYYIEGLLAAKRGDLKTAKNSFLEAQRVDPNGPAAEMLGMISDIYDFYYKDNLNP
jgi:hypothetical protein